jgi:hypothetical protein
MRLFVVRTLCLIAAAMAGSAPLHADGLDPQAAAAYDSLDLMPPSPSLVIVCHGFGCRLHTEIDLTAADRAQLARILHAGHVSPAAERQAIATAVAWFDRRVGPKAGTTHHIARAGHDQMFNTDGQFDCIDASRNTTSLLLLLQELHLLKYHHVDQTVARGAFIDLRWPHATAVVTDRTTGKKWAIDSWTRAYGQKPDVKPLNIWLSDGGF